MYSLFQEVHTESPSEAPSTDPRARETVQMSTLRLSVCYDSIFFINNKNKGPSLTVIFWFK